ncbi:LysR family transcriptional regulator [uncultured Vibrio sp.]|uniref:LysR family transcriptional regulator n=1 Tax=uncultured Vibrio sp. TaxID=114054 RepID=UPI0009239971|nr:LysR family transcriptional regulator [uncultured Vibrio sp.]OIQ25727.1 MAG: LysR family transcriptional regulator [Vibrio sp. MedPE-SWchi]
MAKDFYHQLDLNLLRTFLILSQELNMRKASLRLHVSQPAISQALQKLRIHFDDELFVKVHGGLQPTAFSEELVDAITPHLDGLANSINQINEFDPAKIEQKLTIAVPPIILAALSGSIFLNIKRLAPNAEIELIGWSETTYDRIKNGEVLLGIHYDINDSKEIYSEKLHALEPRVIVRKDHPIKKKIADVEDFSDFEIASVISRGWNDQWTLAAEMMEARGIKAKIGFRSELIMAVIDVTKHSDMFMPISNLFPIQDYPSLRSITPRVDIDDHFSNIYTHYHKRNRKSPLIKWLHTLLKETIDNKILENEPVYNKK